MRERKHLRFGKGLSVVSQRMDSTGNFSRVELPQSRKGAEEACETDAHIFVLFHAQLFNRRAPF